MLVEDPSGVEKGLLIATVEVLSPVVDATREAILMRLIFIVNSWHLDIDTLTGSAKQLNFCKMITNPVLHRGFEG